MEQGRVFFFMPWCELRRPLVVDDVEFVTHDVDSQPNDVDQADVEAIRSYAFPTAGR